MASYTVNDVLVKQLLLTYPVGEVIFVRGVMCSLLIGAVALAFGNAKALRAPMSRMLAVPLAVRRAVHRGLHRGAGAYEARQYRGGFADRAADHHRAVGRALPRGGRLAALDRDRRSALPARCW